MGIDETAFQVFMLAMHENGTSGLGMMKNLEAYEAAKESPSEHTQDAHSVEHVTQQPVECREAFEKWADSKGFITTRYDEDEDPAYYIAKSTQSMWEAFCQGAAWKSKREAAQPDENTIDVIAKEIVSFVTDYRDKDCFAYTRHMELARRIAARISPKRESGELAVIKPAYEVLFSNCPKCGQRLIRNNRGIECGEIGCDYTASELETPNLKEKKNEKR